MYSGEQGTEQSMRKLLDGYAPLMEYFKTIPGKKTRIGAATMSFPRDRDEIIGKWLEGNPALLVVTENRFFLPKPF